MSKRYNRYSSSDHADAGYVFGDSLFRQLAPNAESINVPVRKLARNTKYVTVTEDVLEEIDNELFLCRICLGRIQTPLVAECLHRFCKECMNRHFRHYDEKVTSHRCPLCNSEIRSARSLKPDKKIEDLVLILFPDGAGGGASADAASEDVIAIEDIHKAQAQHQQNVIQMRKRSREMEPDLAKLRSYQVQLPPALNAPFSNSSGSTADYQLDRQRSAAQGPRGKSKALRRRNVSAPREQAAKKLPRQAITAGGASTASSNSLSTSSSATSSPRALSVQNGIDSAGLKSGFRQGVAPALLEAKPYRPRDNSEVLERLAEYENPMSYLTAAFDKLHIPRAYVFAADVKRTDKVLDIGYVRIKLTRHPQEKQLSRLQHALLRVAPDTTVLQLKFFIDEYCQSSVPSAASSRPAERSELVPIGLQVPLPFTSTNVKREMETETPPANKHQLYTLADNSMTMLQAYNWYITKSRQRQGESESESEVMRVLYRSENPPPSEA